MRGGLILAAGGLLLAGCSAAPERPDGGALAAVATPFYVAFKTVGCVATVAVAAPAAAVVGLAERPDRAVMTRELERGMAANCGGRWTLPGS